MLTKITNIYLYGDNGEDTISVKQWLVENGITQFTYLHYGDPTQHESVFAALNTWPFQSGPESFNSFPFVIYNELHDDYVPGSALPLVALVNTTEIFNSNLAELYQLDR